MGTDVGKVINIDDWKASKLPPTSDPVKIYLKKPLPRTPEDTKRALVEAMLRDVVVIAKLYDKRGVNFLDKIQEGNIGLMKAVEEFYPRAKRAIATEIEKLCERQSS